MAMGSFFKEFKFVRNWNFCIFISFFTFHPSFFISQTASFRHFMRNLSSLL